MRFDSLKGISFGEHRDLEQVRQIRKGFERLVFSRKQSNNSMRRTVLGVSPRFRSSYTRKPHASALPAKRCDAFLPNLDTLQVLCSLAGTGEPQ